MNDVGESGEVVFVVTADQIKSRKVGDRVPEALATLERLVTLETSPKPHRPFQRTAGDEIQGLLARPAAVVDAVSALTRLGGWRVGVGIGRCDQPLPDDVRAGTGPAYLGARRAITAARGAPQDLRVITADVGAQTDDAERAAYLAESSLWLVMLAQRRRTAAGWEAADLLTTGAERKAIAARLGISESALSQRLSAAAWQEEGRGRELTAALLDAARTVGAAP